MLFLFWANYTFETSFVTCFFANRKLEIDIATKRDLVEMASSPSLKIVDHAPASSASIAASLASCASPLATCVAAAFHPGLLHKLCDVERCSVSLRWCKIICVLSTKQKSQPCSQLNNDFPQASKDEVLVAYSYSKFYMFMW
ncbi:uncharacterized protein LOC114258110 isoform X3 [Camellia sinensis]|uniref:uncharacterized protein LOC114258110 isoform X3 n=1 Tax=Camellia sinensis TaxID=4442 RepID=UPI0010361A4C|nr:uncharacterized protein LOC114258110 isoform X3 [Camellia sinensis]